MPVPIGSVHGRFQPPHLDHLKYILLAASECEFLYVGITQSKDDALIPTSPQHRHDPLANPLTYDERRKCIEAMLYEAGLAPQKFKVVRFPIEEPSEIRNHIPDKALCFTTVVEPWNHEKISVLENQGFTVKVLYEEPKGISGTNIRNLIIKKNPEWHSLVPPSVKDYLSAIDIEARLGAILDDTR